MAIKRLSLLPLTKSLTNSLPFNSHYFYFSLAEYLVAEVTFLHHYYHQEHYHYTEASSVHYHWILWRPLTFCRLPADNRFYMVFVSHSYGHTSQAAGFGTQYRVINA